ncbi:MAG: hypothetical protein JWQ40_281 [Segetibacter sp.]|nr:hypothetical protein [Segetibacter sp.]
MDPAEVQLLGFACHARLYCNALRSVAVHPELAEGSHSCTEYLLSPATFHTPKIATYISLALVDCAFNRLFFKHFSCRKF